MSPFEGLITALATPLQADAVDADALTRLVERQVRAKVHGVAVCTAAGEGALLSGEERGQVIDVAMRAVAGRVPVYAGVMALATRDATTQVQDAAAAGAAGVFVATPPLLQQHEDALLAHFFAIADAATIPVAICHDPAQSGVALSLASCVRLAAHPRIAAIVVAETDLMRAQQIAHGLADRIGVVSGHDAIHVPMSLAGSRGALCLSANICPEKWVSAWRCLAAKDAAGATAHQLALLGLGEALRLESNPGPLKSAMHLLGLCAADVRAPIAVPARPVLYRIAAELEALGLTIESRELV
ncbi:MAG: dihydrodipicolinate synthase family protein [Myxococcales bacterium]|nr:dihydrodipicolinate synthase family protein [Myxococcales bacterium]